MDVKIENMIYLININQQLDIEKLSEDSVIDMGKFLNLMDITKEELANVWKKQYSTPDELPERWRMIENTKTFPGVICRIPEPKTSMLIFRTGKIISIGAKTHGDIKKATEKLMEIFNLIGADIKEKPITELQNIVATAQLDFMVNLELAALYCKEMEYEPEQFPGLVFRLNEPKAVMLIFKSGKMIITGSRNEKDVELAAIETEKVICGSGAIIHD